MAPAPSGTTRTASPSAALRERAGAWNQVSAPGWTTAGPDAPDGRSAGSSTTTGVLRKIRSSADRIAPSSAWVRTPAGVHSALPTGCPGASGRWNTARMGTSALGPDLGRTEGRPGERGHQRLGRHGGLVRLKGRAEVRPL